MSDRRISDLTDEEALAEGECLRDELEEADREAAPLLAAQWAEGDEGHESDLATLACGRYPYLSERAAAATLEVDVKMQGMAMQSAEEDGDSGSCDDRGLGGFDGVAERHARFLENHPGLEEYLDREFWDSLRRK